MVKVVRGFLKDERAVEGLPVRIVVTAIIFSVVLGLLAKSASDFICDANEKKLMGELDIIEKRASVMYMQGGAGDMRGYFTGTVESIHVKIPDNAAFVVLGGLPGHDGKPPAAIDARTDNIYYYVLKSGRVQAISSIARFAANSTGAPAVLYPGEYELTLELVRNNNGMFVEIGGI